MCYNGGEIMIYIMKQMERFDWTGKSDITPHWSKRTMPMRVVRGKVATMFIHACHQAASVSLPSGVCPLLTKRLTIGTTVVEYIVRVTV
jgi:hypothetical protein